MKVLLVNGSPNENGNTYIALSQVAQTLNANGIDTEIFQIGTTPIASCRGCGACGKIGKCAMNDIVNEFINLAKNADGFVFGSPTHFAGPYGNLVSFMNRVFFAGPRVDRNIFRLKPAAAVTVARRGGNTSVFDQINKFFMISEMPVISSCYWNMAFGAKPGETEQDAEGMHTMRVLGQNMAYFLKCIRAAQNAGIVAPEWEMPIRTNFIRD